MCPTPDARVLGAIADVPVKDARYAFARRAAAGRPVLVRMLKGRGPNREGAHADHDQGREEVAAILVHSAFFSSAFGASALAASVAVAVAVAAASPTTGGCGGSGGCGTPTQEKPTSCPPTLAT